MTVARLTGQVAGVPGACSSFRIAGVGIAPGHGAWGGAVIRCQAVMLAAVRRTALRLAWQARCSQGWPAIAVRTSARVACGPVSWWLPALTGKWDTRSSSSAGTAGSGGRPGAGNADGELSFRGGRNRRVRTVERGQGQISLDDGSWNWSSAQSSHDCSDP